MASNSISLGLKVIAVTSGKGGVGKTNVSANLACIAARAGKRVLIIDADLGLANIEILLGLKPTHHFGDLIDGSVGIKDILVNGPHGIKLLPAGSGLPALSALDDAQKIQVMAGLDQIEDDFDVVIIDTGAGIGDNVTFFVGAAQEVVLVVNPEPTSLIDAYAALKVFTEDAHTKQIGVIVNQVVDPSTAREIFPKLTTVTDRFLAARVRFLGYVPRDENVHNAVMAQKAVVDMHPASPASRSLCMIAEKLFSEDTGMRPLDSGLKFMWKRLLKESSRAG